MSSESDSWDETDSEEYETEEDETEEEKTGERDQEEEKRAEERKQQEEKRAEKSDDNINDVLEVINTDDLIPKNKKHATVLKQVNQLLDDRKENIIRIVKSQRRSSNPKEAEKKLKELYYLM